MSYQPVPLQTTNPVVIDNNPLHITWHDSAWIPILNSTNVLDYFCERSNPFYDRTCNNESIKMQNLDPETHLKNMTGIEYVLIHSQEPILYVIRKQHRHRISSGTPTNLQNSNVSSQPTPQIIMGTTPLADYYIIAGVVYQSPDLASVLNSRILTSLFNCQSAFTESIAMLTNQIKQPTPTQAIDKPASNKSDFGSQNNKNSTLANKENELFIYKSDISWNFSNAPDDPMSYEAKRASVQRVDFIIRDMIMGTASNFSKSSDTGSIIQPKISAPITDSTMETTDSIITAT